MEEIRESARTGGLRLPRLQRNPAQWSPAAADAAVFAALFGGGYAALRLMGLLLRLLGAD